MDEIKFGLLALTALILLSRVFRPNRKRMSEAFKTQLMALVFIGVFLALAFAGVHIFFLPAMGAFGIVGYNFQSIRAESARNKAINKERRLLRREYNKRNKQELAAINQYVPPHLVKPNYLQQPLVPQYNYQQPQQPLNPAWQNQAQMPQQAAPAQWANQQPQNSGWNQQQPAQQPQQQWWG